MGYTSLSFGKWQHYERASVAFVNGSHVHRSRRWVPFEHEPCSSENAVVFLCLTMCVERRGTHQALRDVVDLLGRFAVHICVWASWPLHGCNVFVHILLKSDRASLFLSQTK